MPSSRRNTCVTRREYEVGAPKSETVVRSIVTRYARSPLAPAAMTSVSAAVHLEKRDASQSNVALRSFQPFVVTAAPKSVDGVLV